jgi:hypothetical protein
MAASRARFLVMESGIVFAFTFVRLRIIRLRLGFSFLVATSVEGGCSAPAVSLDVMSDDEFEFVILMVSFLCVVFVLYCVAGRALPVPFFSLSFPLWDEIIQKSVRRVVVALVCA